MAEDEMRTAEREQDLDSRSLTTRDKQDTKKRPTHYSDYPTNHPELPYQSLWTLYHPPSLPYQPPCKPSTSPYQPLWTSYKPPEHPASHMITLLTKQITLPTTQNTRSIALNTLPNTKFTLSTTRPPYKPAEYPINSPEHSTYHQV